MTALRLLLAAVAVASAASAQAPRAATLRGTVLNDADDRPIREAQVSLPGLNLAALTDSAGAFRLAGIAAGQQIVWVRRLGFAPISTVLTFAAGDSLERDFLLVRAVQTLPGVDVSASAPVRGKLSEFEGRRREGFGHFITQDQLEKNENRRLSEVMTTIPGLRIVRGNTNAAWIRSGRPGGGGGRMSRFDLANGAAPGCYSAVVLDGIFVYQGLSGESLWDINSLEPSAIAGIEYYSGAATMPMKYGGTRATCGLVVIWTR